MEREAAAGLPAAVEWGGERRLLLRAPLGTALGRLAGRKGALGASAGPVLEVRFAGVKPAVPVLDVQLYLLTLTSGGLFSV